MKSTFWCLILMFTNARLVSQPTPTSKSTYRSVSLKQGQHLRFTVPANPSTGYSWQWQSVPRKQSIVKVEKKDYVPEHSARIGAAGIQPWHLIARKPGHATIIFYYSRPWEKETAPAKMLTFNICVE